jgi:RNA polymerase sigma factor (sigma-70 family)
MSAYQGGPESVLGAGYSGDVGDSSLVRRAQGGEREALEALIDRHQKWIYNIALRMVGSPDDAEDVAQEILIKVITKLSSFKGRSSFRTWLYRIVVNHVLTMRRKPWERLFSSMEKQGALMDGLELSEPTGPGRAEDKLLAEETRAGCITGMLLCLDRPERMALVLGGFFGVDSTLGGRLLETTPANYRQILSRARSRLGSFMDGRCGLMNEANPCRCERRTRSAIKAGLVDPRKLRFTMSYRNRIEDFVREKAHIAESAMEMRLHGVLRGQPMFEPRNLHRTIKALLRRGGAAGIIDFQ